MAAKLSKTILDRLRSVRVVLAALASKGPLLVERLSERAVASADRGTSEEAAARSSFTEQIDFLRQQLSKAIDKVTSTEMVLYHLRRQTKAARTTLDQRREEVFQTVIRLRRLIRGEFESPDLDFLALFYPTAREALGMLEHAETIVEVLGMEGVEEALGKPSLERTFQVEPRREELRKAAEKLRASLDRTDDLAQRLDKALLAKNEAIEAYDVTFLRTARIFEEYFLYVGDQEMAQRVRPSTRRPGRTEEVAEETPPDGGTSPDGETEEPDDGEEDEESDVPSDDDPSGAGGPDDGEP